MIDYETQRNALLRSMSLQERELARAFQMIAFAREAGNPHDPDRHEKALALTPAPLYTEQAYTMANEAEARAIFFTALRAAFPEEFVS